MENNDHIFSEIDSNIELIKENIINSILNKEIIVEPSPFVIRSIKRELDHKIETCDDKEMLLWIKEMLMGFNGNKKTKVKPTEVSRQ